MIPRKLTFLDKEKLTRHLHSLQGEDRRLRFGMVVTDDYITQYVDRTCGVDDNKWFAVDDVHRYLHGAVRCQN